VRHEGQGKREEGRGKREEGGGKRKEEPLTLPLTTPQAVATDGLLPENWSSWAPVLTAFAA